MWILIRSTIDLRAFQNAEVWFFKWGASYDAWCSCERMNVFLCNKELFRMFSQCVCVLTFLFTITYFGTTLLDVFLFWGAVGPPWYFVKHQPNLKVPTTVPIWVPIWVPIFSQCKLIYTKNNRLRESCSIIFKTELSFNAFRWHGIDMFSWYFNLSFTIFKRFTDPNESSEEKQWWLGWKKTTLPAKKRQQAFQKTRFLNH